MTPDTDKGNSAKRLVERRCSNCGSAKVSHRTSVENESAYACSDCAPLALAAWGSAIKINADGFVEQESPDAP